MPSELMKRFHVLRQTNPESGTDCLINSDSVEPKVGIAGLIRQKGKRRTGIVRIPGGGNLSGGKGEGDIIIPDV
jgi:hypothetical protein